ncbi:hypothetical protein BJV82DRAFT_218469 [Fennellomyces sp. T-0311]|nr:hypothetical protein BJV82DRAFT_218469 [Fennellomyces sp. T-0311]
MEPKEGMEEDRSGKFNPPLWRQRRSFILDILRKYKVSSVVDYGCGEGSVLSFLIPSSDDAVPITKLAGIDICPEVLDEAVECCRPWKDDYEKLREHPLTVDIFEGSVDQFDERLLGYDALVCSEVIEHLFAPVLDKFLQTTLGEYNPSLLIVTTPNAEYNVNFEGLNYNTPNAIFRHDDHKFEWTRAEFESWCRAGAEIHNYDVAFHGIGLVEGKRHDLSVGHCTQACVFTRRDPSSVPSPSRLRPHRLIEHIEFPYYSAEPLSDQQILLELESYIALLCQYEQPADEPVQLQWWGDETVVQTQQPKKRYTQVPQKFPSSILWDILRIRQVCQWSKQRMVQILSAHPEYYRLEGDLLVVQKAFELENDDEDEWSCVSSYADDDNVL